jgi:hypothetical protein
MNDSRQRILRILFWTFEALFVGSSIVIWQLGRYAGDLLFILQVISFVPLLVVSFLLWRADWRLGFIGWFSAIGLFLSRFILKI